MAKDGRNHWREASRIDLNTPSGSMKEEGMVGDMSDLGKRWEDLNRKAYGQSTLLLERLFDFTREVMERLEVTEKAMGHRTVKGHAQEKLLDCE
jgi:hypothetical protein